MRIFPEMWPRTTCPFSNFTRNVALGKFSRISPCIWMTSSLDMGVRVVALLVSAGLEVRLLQQRLVLLAHHITLYLGPEVHRHHDDDQQRGAAEVERHVVLQHQELGQEAYQRDVDGAGERQPRE